MTIQWHLTTHPAADVLQLTGYLGDDAVTRFTGAIGWALARGDGPLLLDLTHLKGWSTAGRDAVTRAADQLAVRQRPLELVSPPADAAVPAVTVHPDLSTALTVHRRPRGADSTDPAGAVWHSSGWDEGSPGS